MLDERTMKLSELVNFIGLITHEFLQMKKAYALWFPCFWYIVSHSTCDIDCDIYRSYHIEGIT